MSGRPRLWTAELARVPVPAPWIRRAAQLTVAGHAHDAADLADLLTVLGLGAR